MQEFTVGDSPHLEMIIRDSDGSKLDLTNHTVQVQTKINNEAHDTVSALVSGDQVANKGKATVSLSPAILDKQGLLELRVQVIDAASKIFNNLNEVYFRVKPSF
jgi:hypothetical protein|tara:strand:+ start:19966 stop:20277 length:312 start_codon:yes stop_codon:yes gene_type:complete